MMYPGAPAKRTGLINAGRMEVRTPTLDEDLVVRAQRGGAEAHIVSRVREQLPAHRQLVPHRHANPRRQVNKYPQARKQIPLNLKSSPTER